MTTPDLETRLRDVAARTVGAVGVAGVGLIHLLDAPGKFAETRYMFWMYIALMVGSLLISAELLRGGSRLAWAGAGALTAGALAGFILTRTVGLPQAQDDVGNWTEPLGMASLWVEGCVFVLSAGMLAAHGRVSRPRRARAVLAPA